MECKRRHSKSREMTTVHGRGLYSSTIQPASSECVGSACKWRCRGGGSGCVGLPEIYSLLKSDSISATATVAAAEAAAAAAAAAVTLGANNGAFESMDGGKTLTRKM